MEKQFEYIANRDYEVTDTVPILRSRVIAVLFLGIGLYNFLSEGKSESNFEIFRNCFYVIFGTYTLLYPEGRGKPFWLHNDEIIIDQNKLTWKFFSKKESGELVFDEIENYWISVGDVRFQTKDGRIFTLVTHKIRNKKKLDEFLDILIEKLGTATSSNALAFG